MPREPVVAGRFYPAKEKDLRASIESMTPEDQERGAALGVLSPHAGYAFSGGVMGATFARVEMPGTVLLLNPSHSYASPAFALWTGGNWRTPLGEVELNQSLCSALSRIPGVTPDDRPHLPEHSAEVVVPFLQYHRPDVQIAVICVTASASLADLKELGGAIPGALAACGEEDALIVTSSDMSHESGARAREVVDRHDPLAIDQMERLDADGLFRVCRQQGITMCGVLPAVAMMAAVTARGGTAGELVGRATSADSPLGSGSYVVGYAGMLFR